MNVVLVQFATNLWWIWRRIAFTANPWPKQLWHECLFRLTSDQYLTDLFGCLSPDLGLWHWSSYGDAQERVVYGKLYDERRRENGARQDRTVRQWSDGNHLGRTRQWTDPLLEVRVAHQRCRSRVVRRSVTWQPVCCHRLPGMGFLSQERNI